MRIDQTGQGITPDEGAGQQATEKSASSQVNTFSDSVERFNSLLNLYDNFLQVSSVIPEGGASAPEYNAQLLQEMQQGVDAAIEQARLAGPQGGETTTGSSGWGASLRDASQKGLEAGWDAAKGAMKVGDKDESFPLNEQETYGDAKMPKNLTNLGRWGKGTTIAEEEWHAAQVGAVDESATGDWGSAYAKGATEFLKLQGRIYGDAGFKDWTVTAGIGAQGRIELVGSHYEVGYTSPSILNFGGHDININGKVNADASVGVMGDVHAEIGIGKNTHLSVGAGGFAGASASLAGQVGVGDFGSLKGGVTAWAGIGAKADIDVGFSDGKFSFNFGAGLALGLGLEVDWGFTIDFYAIGDSIYNFASDSIDWVADAGEWVGGAAEDVAGAVGDAAQAVGDAAEDAVDAIGNAAEDVAGAIGDAGDAVGDAISDVCDW